MPLRRGLSLRAGVGVYQQEPSIQVQAGQFGNARLRPERAYDVDVGVEGRIGGTARWQVTAYNREDRDLLRLPAIEYRISAEGILVPFPNTRYENALDGYARGVEWLVERETVNGFSGWASYALGFNHYRDTTTGESFWGDFDQRHTINLYGNYRFSDRFSLGARFRAGSNFPAAGYWTERDGKYYVASDRNTLRVPMYARADVRANRTFTWAQKRLTLYVEGINLFNRDNVRATLPTINLQTFEATHLFDSMVPLVPSVGVLLEF
jgi:outer membrane receptor protein involved in Fe transport